MKKRRKLKIPKVDGLGPKDEKRLRTAIRNVWRYNHARKLCLDRAVAADGFGRCENRKCKQWGKPVPQLYADHIHPCGVFDVGFITRCFVPSNRLQALCKICHSIKTREENKIRRDALKEKLVEKSCKFKDFCDR